VVEKKIEKKVAEKKEGKKGKEIVEKKETPATKQAKK